MCNSLYYYCVCVLDLLSGATVSNTPDRQDLCPGRTTMYGVTAVVVVASHIQRIGCQPEKPLYTVANPARGLLNRKKKKNVWQHPLSPPPPRVARSEKIKIEITRRIHMSRCYASRCYAGLGSYRVRTRIPTTRWLGHWVSLRKILRFRVRLQLSQSRCFSFLLAMSGRIFLFFPPRGREPPPTLRERLNPDLSL